jgi:hypothetical protein
MTDRYQTPSTDNIEVAMIYAALTIAKSYLFATHNQMLAAYEEAYAAIRKAYEQPAS